MAGQLRGVGDEVTLDTRSLGNGDERALIFCCEIGISVRRCLHDLKIERLFPGHGAPLLADAQRDIERANARFLRLGVPPTLAGG